MSLAVTDARKRFGDVTALDGASLDVPPGRWLGLLGPNGAGKTTLVRAIMGRARLDGGGIQWNGAALDETASTRSARADIGFVPQDIALYETLTAEENLRAWGELNGVRGADLGDRVRWALEWTHLAERAGERVKGFSGGMKRRLNLAAGVLHRPTLIVLDEPTVGVDPQSRTRIWDMLKELHVGGATILLTTHQLDEAQRVCEHIAILDHGRVLADGTFDELLSQTLGVQRLVRFRVDAVRDVPEGFDAEGDAGLRRGVRNVADELPEALAAVRATGAAVLDIDVQAPSLQDVFIHLTGRELRE